MKIFSTMVALLAVASAPLLVGCSSEPEARTALEVVEMQPSGASTLPVGSANGRPARLKAGEPTALWIGRGADGEYWVRTTTQGERHIFTGRIRAQGGGEIVNVKPTKMDFNDRVKHEGKDVVFDIHTKGDEDGFNFSVAKNACVEFVVRIDGKPDTTLVYLGEKEARPPSTHFVVCP
jgi:hypothetical protein